MSFTKLLAGALILSASVSLPALADHDHDRNWHDNGRNHHENNWRNDNHRNNNNWHDNRRDWNNDNQRRVSNRLTWQQERDLYRNNWSRMDERQRRQLDKQMRAQWAAYHQNQAYLSSQAYHNNPNYNWQTNNGWNNYSDPGFMDYLHSSNPSMLTTIRSYLGF